MRYALILCFVSSICFSQHVIVLGTAQDGGFPHIGCMAECQRAHENPSLARYVVSLALVDPESEKWWLFEATPDMDKQLQYFQKLTNKKYPYLPEGIFITHAHIGHYTGLMFLGREALGARDVKVYGLPKMMNFLKTNGPWSQLSELKNIQLRSLEAENKLILNDRISVTPYAVPHRDEYSETAGFHIQTTKRNYLFIPDIDKWGKWDRKIIEQVKKVDFAFLDASFYEDGELPNRAMSEVPHPFVAETMELFKDESRLTKGRIYFIHFNHTNPLLFDSSVQIKVLQSGFRLAEQGTIY